MAATSPGTTICTTRAARACALMSMGLAKGDRAAIIGDNCPEWVIADLGVQCCGRGRGRVYSTNAWPQVEYVVEHSESKFFFVENEEQLDKWLQFRDNRPAPTRSSSGTPKGCGTSRTRW